MDGDYKELWEETSGTWGVMCPEGNNEEDCEYLSTANFGIFKADIRLILVISLGP